MQQKLKFYLKINLIVTILHIWFSKSFIIFKKEIALFLKFDYIKKRTFFFLFSDDTIFTPLGKYCYN